MSEIGDSLGEPFPQGSIVIDDQDVAMAPRSRIRRPGLSAQAALPRHEHGRFPARRPSPSLFLQHAQLRTARTSVPGYLSGTPCPLSRTRRHNLSARCSAATSMEPPAGVFSIAFKIRLSRARCICSASNSGGVSADGAGPPEQIQPCWDATSRSWRRPDAATHNVRRAT